MKKILLLSVMMLLLIGSVLGENLITREMASEKTGSAFDVRYNVAANGNFFTILEETLTGPCSPTTLIEIPIWLEGATRYYDIVYTITGDGVCTLGSTTYSYAAVGGSGSGTLSSQSITVTLEDDGEESCGDGECNNGETAITCDDDCDTTTIPPPDTNTTSFDLCETLEFVDGIGIDISDDTCNNRYIIVGIGLGILVGIVLLLKKK